MRACFGRVAQTVIIMFIEIVDVDSETGPESSLQAHRLNRYLREYNHIAACVSFSHELVPDGLRGFFLSQEADTTGQLLVNLLPTIDTFRPVAVEVITVIVIVIPFS